MGTIIEKRENGTLRCAIVFEKPSLTEQQHKKNVNINTIVKKAKRRGFMEAPRRQGFFGDFSDAVDYQATLEKIRTAHEDFMALPSNVRAKFQNDPGEIFEFLANPENDEEARDLGLLEPMHQVILPIDEKASPEAPTPPDPQPSGGSGK